MRIRAGLLFWGIFFLLLGGIPLLVRAGVLDANAVADAWRLWPLLLVALGVSLILGRTSAGLLGTVLAAVVLGIAAGGVLASGTNFIGNVGGCGPGTTTDQQLQDGGTFTGPATASFDLDCGALDVSTKQGSDWSAQAKYRGAAPTLDRSDTTLALHSPDGFGVRRQDWTAALPIDQTQEVRIDANASTVSGRFAGAQLDDLPSEHQCRRRADRCLRGDARSDRRLRECGTGPRAGRFRHHGLAVRERRVHRAMHAAGRGAAVRARGAVDVRPQPR